MKKSIGVIIHSYKDLATTKQPFEADAYFFRHLFLEAPKLDLNLFIFTPQNIDWQKKTINALFKENGRFIKKIVEFPDVVYDRMFSKNPEQIAIFRKLHQQFKRLKIPIVNSRALIKLTADKWQFYQSLSKNKFLKNHLPDTRLYQKPIAKQMLNQYGEIILKPKYGDLGTGIISISRKKFIVPIYSFEYQIKTDNQPKTHKEYHCSLKPIPRLIKKLWPRQPIYIVQEKLPVAQYKGRPFDLRVIAQKEKNHWVISVLRARIAPLNGFLANFSAGGKTIAKGKDIIQSIFPKQSDVIIKKINALSIDIAKYLEQSTGPTLELGLDFILDNRGKIWIIEANSKPGRCLFSREEQKLITYPLTYLLWLTEQKSPI